MGVKVVACLFLLVGCDLYFDPSSDSEGAVDGGAAPETDCDRPFTATIFEPTAGQVLSPNVTTRVRWNQETPDRYSSMSDHYGNYFLSSPGPGDVQGDGSIVNHYALPANGAFVYEIGWLCDVEHGGRTAILARVEFTTGP
jgi:hypothetical protein